MRKKFSTLMLSLIMIISLCSCTVSPSEHSVVSVEPNMVNITQDPTRESIDIPESSKFEVHFIDVGQADATLLLCDDKTMLIDGGNPDDSNLIVAYLKKLNIEHLDFLICSHAHDDHVGGISGALSVATAGKVFAPKTENDIRSYINFKKKVSAQNLKIENPLSGETFAFGRSKVLFLGPVHEATENLNNTSIMIKITYGNTSFLFTGDAEHEEELSVIEQGYDLSADVLKVGHHGSSYSTSYLFLRKIMPKYGVISVGKHNSYGHPSEQTISRLNDADVAVYRTDLQGDIIFSSDGKNISVKTQKNSTLSDEPADAQKQTTEPMKYIGNKNSMKFHYPKCSSVKAMKESNKIYFNCSRDEIISDGFIPCQRCLP